MKSFIVLLALVGIAAAARPASEQVITKFKTVAPLYKAAMDAEESRLVGIKSNLTTQLVDFHLAVINSKETFVNGVIAREEYILEQIGGQDEAVDTVCLGFVRTSSEMNVNLAGVSFTNCINAADAALSTKVTEYYGSVGQLEAKVTQLRLLDVFKGNNVFYTPAAIIAKLDAKLASLEDNPTLTAAETEALALAVANDLGAILNTYNTCMVGANNLLEQGLSMCEMQLTAICGATLTPAVISTFKEVAPQYAGAMNQNDDQLQQLQHQGSDAIVKFHSDIITVKETSVVSIIKQEDDLEKLIDAQDTAVADAQCMAFIETATNENVNLIGVAYTTCVNKADEELDTVVTSYYGRIGNLEVAMTDLRLLDVFKGDNVFFTPQNIVTKLRNKLTALSDKLAPLAEGMEEELEALETDLEAIRDNYITCMVTAESRFRDYIVLAKTQLTAICSGSLEATPAPAPEPEASPAPGPETEI
ncbi:hypothetical protein ZHAS_00017665 [Anopheles sinensis]|uniref:Uncharacterized protein n=1 Tax=Anopheles sinensis TaxID=74873 RepID=A0A084WHF2_ANOSI|nr:hypothetical protein ZHAS_00017665 [Anopheles sinensis]